MRNRKGYKAIKAAMRANEVSLLAHIRKYDGVPNMTLLGRSWIAALDRLVDGNMVRYSSKKNMYVARKGARPVTAAVR